MAEKWAINERPKERITRRRFVGTLSAAGTALTGTLGCDPTSRTRASAEPEGHGQASAYRTRPDFRPPAMELNTSSSDAAPGYIFVSRKKEPGEIPSSGRAPEDQASAATDRKRA